MSDWDDYSMHILESLKRIEHKMDQHDKETASQNLRNETRFRKIEEDVIRTGTNLAWHSRVASLVAVLIGTVISWIIGGKHNG